MEIAHDVPPRGFWEQSECSDPNQEVQALNLTPLSLREYLESREGRVWRRKDTLKVLDRAKQIDALIEQLMRAAGVEIVD